MGGKGSDARRLSCVLMVCRQSMVRRYIMEMSGLSVTHAFFSTTPLKCIFYEGCRVVLGQKRAWYIPGVREGRC